MKLRTGIAEGKTPEAIYIRVVGEEEVGFFFS